MGELSPPCHHQHTILSVSGDTSPGFVWFTQMLLVRPSDRRPIRRIFPERNKAPDITTFLSFLRITAKYEMPAIRSQILEAIREAYPETFEGFNPSNMLGESVSSGPTPHVLNLFVQQNLTSALPMAYYNGEPTGPRFVDG